MAKLDLPQPQSRRARKRFGIGGLLVAAVFTGVATVESAPAFGEARERLADTTLRPFSTASVVLRAAKTWTLHRPAERQAFAILAVRCLKGGKLALHLSFPDRVWNGDTSIQYRLDRSRPRHVRPPPRRQRLSRAEWLGGDDLVRELVRADMLEVLIDDTGFGVSEAVFYLAGAKEALRRIEETCGDGQAPPAAVTADPRPAGTATPRAARTRLSDHQPGRRDLPKTPPERSPSGDLSSAAPSPPPEQEQRPAAQQHSSSPLKEPPKEQTLPSGPPGVITPPARPERLPEAQQAEKEMAEPTDRPAALPDPPPIAPSPPALSAPGPTPQNPATSERAADRPTVGGHTAPSSAAEAPVAARPTEPPKGDTAEENAPLAAFFRKYGPNRRDELIYDWYYQCLEHAGLDRERVWYLSDEDLMYLSKGETDQVRLAMLISTTRDLDVSPRRLVCYGTAQGRDLAIERAE